MVSLDYSSASAPTGVALLLGERPIDHRVRNVWRRDSDLADIPESGRCSIQSACLKGAMYGRRRGARGI